MSQSSRYVNGQATNFHQLFALAESAINIYGKCLTWAILESWIGV